jgi:hypothetical protein
MATITFTLSVASAASTAVNLTPQPPVSGSGNTFSVVGPLAAGVTVLNVNVLPSSWQGSLALSGPDAAMFNLSGMAIMTAAAIPDGTTCNVTATATP